MLLNKFQRSSIRPSRFQLLIFLACFLVFFVIALVRYQRRHTQTYGWHGNTTAEINAEPLCSKRLTIWINDVHPAAAADLRSFVEPMGVNLIEFNLGGPDQCRFFNVCDGRNKIKVLTWKNLIRIAHDPIKWASEFYAAYKNDPVMKSVDAFFCSDVIANCQLYIPFNKSLVILATTRYYVWRTEIGVWRRWTDDLKRFAADPRNVIAANNLYDAKFIKYFTGFEPIHIPTYASYTKATYNPRKPIYVIIIRYQQWLATNFIAKFNAYNCSAKVQLVPSDYKYTDLAQYRGIIHIPYQVSTMSIFEQYRMNVPLFFPTKSLLVKWAVDHWLLRERTHPWFQREPKSPPPDESQRHLPSPNNNSHAAAFEYWLQFADFYTMPHIQYFDSLEQLGKLLCRQTTEDLLNVSQRMKQYNSELKANLTGQWRRITQKLVQSRSSCETAVNSTAPSK